MLPVSFFKPIGFLLLCSSVGAQIHIPSNGSYSVSISTAKLTDPSRIDPLDPNNGTRSIMTSLFYPVPKKSCSKHCPFPYLPALTASIFNGVAGFPNGTLESFQLEVCCETKASYKPKPSSFPLVLLSHGLGGTRLVHSAQAQALAASGYAVLTIDHPYDATIVEYPNEPPVIGYLNNITHDEAGRPNLEILNAGVHLRVADVSFALDELSKPEVVSQLVPGADCTFNTTHAAIFGHSYGGAAAILALEKEPRIIGGFDMDGSLYGLDNSTTITKPAVLLGTDVHNSTNDQTWADGWAQMQGFKREFVIENTRHLVHMDVVWLLELSGLPPTPLFVDQLGELGLSRGKYVFDVILDLVESFMDYVFEGKKSVLLDDPGSVYPEVVEVEN
ncbi:PAF acetylhydrolase family protein [Corynespora cassiicola Philippines]|uniref:1-alkyl-2-acetylglycerophosphocholine esterase n=1 Tax=Corynespora cassiicola Philippines TaxID=1448308 RepID=A0A2T2NHT8_CORCC|nr:PAF acetylhydrolase family protein [Corynespora cassiicola Philippines]